MEELEEVEIIVGYGVQWENMRGLVHYRGMEGSWVEANYAINNTRESSGGCIYSWLVKLAVF